jgi:hypothetical protein
LFVQDSPDDFSISNNGAVQTHSLSHLRDLCIDINGFVFENNVVDNIKIFVRPTNHVYSRKFDSVTDNTKRLKENGELIIKYEYHEDNPSKLKKDAHGLPAVSTDVRVFCHDKYTSSYNIPAFVESLGNYPSKFCVLANKGDDRTCLTGLFEFPQGERDNNCFIVLFKLHRINSRELSMVIETAFIVEHSDLRARRIIAEDTGKPFLVIIKNIFAKRRPFEGAAQKRSKKKYKKLKKQKQKK